MRLISISQSRRTVSLIAGFIGAVALATTGCGKPEGSGNSQPAVSAQSTRPATNNPPKPTPAPTQVSPKLVVLNSRQMYRDIQADHKAFAAKHEGVVLQTEGQVNSLSLQDGGPVLGKMWAMLLVADPEPNATPNARESTDYILCVTKKPGLWKQVGQGGRVTVKGTFDPSWKYLENCEIVKFQGEPTRQISAEELAREYSTDPKSSMAKNHKKSLFVKGKVVALYPDNLPDDQKVGFGQLGYSAFAVLKGDEKRDIPIHIPLSVAQLQKEVKVGDDLEVMGTGEVLPELPAGKVAKHDKYRIGVVMAYRISQSD